MSEKVDVFTLLPVAGTVQGVKAVVGDSIALSLLRTVNVPGFIDTHM